MTETQLEVLRLVAAGRPLGDYVPRYRPGARRGRGAFPVTIAARAARALVVKGLLRGLDREPFYELTEEGREALAASS